MRNGSRKILAVTLLVGLFLVLSLYIVSVVSAPRNSDGTSATRPRNPTATPGNILWSADMETGDLSQWECCGPDKWTEGGGVYNSGNGATTVTTEVAHSSTYAGKNAVKSSVTSASGEEACRVFRTHLERVGITQAYYSAWYYFA